MLQKRARFDKDFRVDVLNVGQIAPRNRERASAVLTRDMETESACSLVRIFSAWSDPRRPSFRNVISSPQAGGKQLRWDVGILFGKTIEKLFTQFSLFPPQVERSNPKCHGGNQKP